MSESAESPLLAQQHHACDSDSDLEASKGLSTQLSKDLSTDDNGLELPTVWQVTRPSLKDIWKHITTLPISRISGAFPGLLTPALHHPFMHA